MLADIRTYVVRGGPWRKGGSNRNVFLTRSCISTDVVSKIAHGNTGMAEDDILVFRAERQ